MPRLPQFRLRKPCKVQLMRTTREERIQSAQPTVSIVIPCHNHGEYLGQAIESVLKHVCAQLLKNHPQLYASNAETLLAQFF
jgi:hypothetical protein